MWEPVEALCGHRDANRAELAQERWSHFVGVGQIDVMGPPAWKDFAEIEVVMPFRVFKEGLLQLEFDDMDLALRIEIDAHRSTRADIDRRAGLDATPSKIERGGCTGSRDQSDHHRLPLALD